MSTERCDHGHVISDTGGGEYRCYQCDPFGPADVSDLRAEVDALEHRVRQLERGLKATHRCKVCDARWAQLGDGTWTLVSEECGQCCDNVPMGEQIEALP